VGQVADLPRLGRLASCPKVLLRSLTLPARRV
jgi:hypothetical protein